MEHLELTRMIFVTGFIRVRRTSDTKISQRIGQAEEEKKMRRRKKYIL
jgi:hypothetical protein